MSAIIQLKIPHPRGRVRDAIVRERLEVETIGPCHWSPEEATQIEMTREQAAELWSRLGVHLFGLRIEIEGVSPVTACCH